VRAERAEREAAEARAAVAASSDAAAQLESKVSSAITKLGIASVNATRAKEAEAEVRSDLARVKGRLDAVCEEAVRLAEELSDTQRTAESATRRANQTEASLEGEVRRRKTVEERLAKVQAEVAEARGLATKFESAVSVAMSKVTGWQDRALAAETQLAALQRKAETAVATAREAEARAESAERKLRRLAERTERNAAHSATDWSKTVQRIESEYRERVEAAEARAASALADAEEKAKAATEAAAEDADARVRRANAAAAAALEEQRVALLQQVSTEWDSRIAGELATARAEGRSEGVKEGLARAEGQMKSRLRDVEVHLQGAKAAQDALVAERATLADEVTQLRQRLESMSLEVAAARRTVDAHDARAQEAMDELELAKVSYAEQLKAKNAALDDAQRRERAEHERRRRHTATSSHAAASLASERSSVRSTGAPRIVPAWATLDSRHSRPSPQPYGTTPITPSAASLHEQLARVRAEKHALLASVTPTR
jgi:chromosome segregation ATPase